MYATNVAGEIVEAFNRGDWGWRQAFADVTGTVHRTVGSGDTVAQEITWEGTHTGPLEGPGGTLAPTGRRAPVRATMWFLVEGDRVREIHHHLDLMALLQGLGAMPEAAKT